MVLDGKTSEKTTARFVESSPTIKQEEAGKPEAETAAASYKAETISAIDLLRQAKQIKMHIVKSNEVVSVNDFDIKRRPAWNLNVVQKAPADTIDALILDRQGSLFANPDLSSKPSSSGVVGVGIESESLHWSPLYLSETQQATIRDIISFTQTESPSSVIPQQWKETPPQCFPQLSIKGGLAGYEAANSRLQPVSGALEKKQDSEQFKKLDMQKLSDRIVVAVSRNEGSFNTINTNDAGYGWSVGMRQWNQHIGELPELIGAMYRRDPCKFVRDFGPFASEMINNVNDPEHATVNESFVRNGDFNALLGYKNQKRSQVNYMEDIQNALNDFQDVQLALSRKFAQQGISLARKYGFKSELGWAEVCDIVNQRGAGNAERALKSVPRDLPESERIELLEKAIKRSSGQARLANLKKQFSTEELAKN